MPENDPTQVAIEKAIDELNAGGTALNQFDRQNPAPDLSGAAPDQAESPPKKPTRTRKAAK